MLQPENAPQGGLKGHGADRRVSTSPCPMPPSRFKPYIHIYMIPGFRVRGPPPPPEWVGSHPGEGKEAVGLVL